MKIISAESLRLKSKVFGIEDARNLHEMKKYPSVSFHHDDNFEGRIDWCQKNLGNNWIWSAPPQSDDVWIYFLHGQDAVAFKLTWPAY